MALTKQNASALDTKRYCSIQNILIDMTPWLKDTALEGQYPYSVLLQDDQGNEVWFYTEKIKSNHIGNLLNEVINEYNGFLYKNTDVTILCPKQLLEQEGGAIYGQLCEINIGMLCDQAISALNFTPINNSIVIGRLESVLDSIVHVCWQYWMKHGDSNKIMRKKKFVNSIYHYESVEREALHKKWIAEYKAKHEADMYY